MCSLGSSQDAPCSFPKKPPEHVAVIMDGNRRWAMRAKFSQLASGYRQGIKAVEQIVENALNVGVSCLTLFALSTENYENRSPAEVATLLSLMEDVLRNKVPEFHKQSVKVRFIGDHSAFPNGLKRLMDSVEKKTAENAVMTLVIAVNYGGRWDVLQAVKSVAVDVEQGRLSSADLDENVFSGYLSLYGLSDPDLCIRTGGECRVSNFLLWNFAYTEFYFTDIYWPDFSEKHFLEALEAFHGRDRRYGRSV